MILMTFQNISSIIIKLSTHCLVPVRYSVVVVLQQPAAVLGQTLNSLQPQPTGQLLTAARPHSSAATAAATAAAPQCTHPAQLQHRRHEHISQPAVPRHGGNNQKGFLGQRSRKFSVLVQGRMNAVGHNPGTCNDKFSGASLCPCEENEMKSWVSLSLTLSIYYSL